MNGGKYDGHDVTPAELKLYLLFFFNLFFLRSNFTHSQSFQTLLDFDVY